MATQPIVLATADDFKSYPVVLAAALAHTMRHPPHGPFAFLSAAILSARITQVG